MQNRLRKHIRNGNDTREAQFSGLATGSLLLSKGLSFTLCWTLSLLLGSCGHDVRQENRRSHVANKTPTIHGDVVAIPPEWFASQIVDRAENRQVYGGYSAEEVAFSVYAHAHQMANWFLTGPAALGTPEEIIDIKLYLDPQSSLVNEAFYRPSDANPSGRASITLGWGDGKSLHNTPLDPDIIYHELAHHYIYRSVTSSLGEAGVIHEGIADYFTAAMTGDPCVGDQVCVDDSPVCFLPSQCLRTVDNELNYADFRGKGAPAHLASQAVSGFLWDLTGSDFTTPDGFVKIVADSLADLPAQASLQDLVENLVFHSRSLPSGEARIREAAGMRGL